MALMIWDISVGEGGEGRADHERMAGQSRFSVRMRPASWMVGWGRLVCLERRSRRGCHWGADWEARVSGCWEREFFELRASVGMRRSAVALPLRWMVSG
jgi:hypothetical protein